MTALTAYRLRPLAPLHLGTGRAGDLADLDDLPRSDTVAAALISLWRHIDQRADIAALASNPPFAVSSALPTIRTTDVQWSALLPMPIGQVQVMAGTPSEQKKLRRAHFIVPELLTSLLAGRSPRGAKVVSNCFLSAEGAREYPGGLWTKQSRLRLAVNRLGDGPIPELLYDFGAIHFDPNVRLTVVAAFSDTRVQGDFEGVLRLLGDEGVGADRSAGYGRFEVEADEPFSLSLGAGMRLSLSLLHPTEAEVTSGLLDEPARYDLVTRGGWVTNPGARTLRKQNVRMLSEGSVIRDLGCEQYGDSTRVLHPMPELGLHHAVYRPGVAVTVPIEGWPEQS